MSGEIVKRRKWCILRTAGRRTLPLAESLAAAGYDVWTPRIIVSRRIPRSRARREQPAPLMPTFVFASTDRLADLRALAGAMVKDHPDFSIFHHFGLVPVINDADLEHVRAAEKAMAPKRKPKRAAPLPAGERVRIPSGAFAGLSGIVESSDGRHTLVCFGGRLSVKIDTFLLVSDVVKDACPVTGTAA